MLLKVFFVSTLIIVGVFGVACEKTLTGDEAFDALEIERTYADIESLQLNVTIKNKTSSKVDGKATVLGSVYPRRSGDATVLGEVTGEVKDVWNPNESKSFTFPIKRNQPIPPDFETHVFLMK